MVMKTRYYADGGKVASERPPRPRPPAPKPPPKGDTVRVSPPSSAADAIRNTRERQMKALGLKDGGKVPPKAKQPIKGRASSGARMPPPSRIPSTPLPPPKPARQYRNGGKVKKRR